MKRLVLTFAILIGLAAPAWADFQKGVDAFYRGDYDTALREFEPAGEKSDPKVQYFLGAMYFYGRPGFPQNFAEAVKWYRRAAEQGHVEAQAKLGHMYNKGLGVPQDYAEAIRWFKRAANQSSAGAQNSLGIMYQKGRGVIQDYVRAHMWFNLAVSKLSLNSATRYLAKGGRATVAKKMTPAQIAEAQRLAREWKPKKEGK